MSLFQNTQPNEKIGKVEGETGRTEGMGKLTETDARSKMLWNEARDNENGWSQFNQKKLMLIVA